MNYLGSPDNGVILTGYIGSWLMAGAYLAISCITSAMTRTQVVSFIVSVVVCLFLILAGFPPVIELARRLGQPVAGGCRRVVQRHHAFRGLPKGRARFARRDVLPVAHRLLAVHHERHPARASRGLERNCDAKKISRNLSLLGRRRGGDGADPRRRQRHHRRRAPARGPDRRKRPTRSRPARARFWPSSIRR